MSFSTFDHKKRPTALRYCNILWGVVFLRSPPDVPKPMQVGLCAFIHRPYIIMGYLEQ